MVNQINILIIFLITVYFYKDSVAERSKALV